MIYGTLLFVVGVVLAIVAAVWRDPTWTVPLIGGAIAAITFALYQRWWVYTNFPGDPDVVPTRIRRHLLRERLHVGRHVGRRGRARV